MENWKLYARKQKILTTSNDEMRKGRGRGKEEKERRSEKMKGK